MARHRNVHSNALCLDFWINLSDSPGCYRCLKIVFSPAVLKGKQALAHWIAVADSAIVDKRELCVAPAEQIPSDLASKRPRSEQQAFGFLEHIQVQIGRLSPLH